ncbi:MAG: 1-deoxy-D-xylulose-5-phosphate reductoisomerase [Planctomycetes bacterium GWF2_50_10]|nr:MAG: 1-deoxy-D-xylulose-5-phosphate reductoisomerase [Planctomycetes bacterium GWF2_50_10]
MPRNIAILGSTGSIGKNALRVIESLGPDNYRVLALTAHNSVDLLIEQCRIFKPAYVAITNPASAAEFTRKYEQTGTKLLTGPDGLVEIALMAEVDTVLTAVVGAAGLPAVLAAANAGKTLAIANKEPLVIAGQLLTTAAAKSGAKILPVDSEHSAIFQSLQAGSAGEVQKIILTASGGPFRCASREEIYNATVSDALAHPTWNMGPKITIDSATMMNKALEVIEAKWLFNVPVEKIEVLIHPESIVHSMVEFIDGSVIAQLGTPDMCLPIQYALTYPARQKGISPHLNLAQLGTLTFASPDMQTFRALALGYQAAKAGLSAPVVFNAANEIAVEAFLAGKIKFGNIVEIIEYCLDKHNASSSISLEQLLEADSWARNEVTRWLKQKSL